MTSIKYGLSLNNKSKSAPNKPAPAKRKAIFGDDDDDDDDQPEQAAATTAPNAVQEITTFDLDANPVKAASPPPRTTSPAKPSKPTLKSKDPLSHQAQSLSSLRSAAKVTSDLDPSIYDYDSFHNASLAAQRARKEDVAKSKSNGQDYMTDLMAAAEQRKKDQARAKDRLLQREREQEGDEFKDKDMFVTEAYKEHQAEVRKAEAEEEKRVAEQERKKRTAGMSAFHRSMMDEQEKRHAEVLEAEKRFKESGAVVDADADAEPTEKEKSDADLAKEFASQGRTIELNAEGQATDKRDLLSGGLNIVAKPKSTFKTSERDADTAARTQAQASFRPNMDARQAQRERQTRMMEAQLEAATKRKAEEEVEEAEKRERAAKSQKTQGEISSAKERYLQRKREAAGQGEG